MTTPTDRPEADEPDAGASGDPEARSRSFEELALPLLRDLTRYAASLTRDPHAAADLAQETFTQAFLHWHQFRPGSQCRPWLFTICRNLHFRIEHRARRFVEASTDDEATHDLTLRHGEGRLLGIERALESPDVGPAIAAAIEQLPARFRDAVLLVDVNDFSYEEAAEVLRVPVGTVRSRLFRARRLLQGSLRQHAIDAGLLQPARVSP